MNEWAHYSTLSALHQSKHLADNPEMIIIKLTTPWRECIIHTLWYSKNQMMSGQIDAPIWAGVLMCAQCLCRLFLFYCEVV